VPLPLCQIICGSLLSAFKEEHSQTSGPHVVALLGEMGAGKSFLLHNIQCYAQRLQLTTLPTTCQEIEQGVAFAPLVAMIKAWLGDLRNEEVSLFPRPILATLAHLLPELLTRVPSLAPTPFLCVEHLHNALITTFVNLITTLCTRHSLLITIDDLQWIDEASLVVLHRLAQPEMTKGDAGQHCSLLVMLTYRPEDVLENMPLHTTLLSLGRNTSFSALRLPRFRFDEVEQYVHIHDSAHALSAEQLYQVTQGNALFLTEAIRMLLDKQEQYVLTQKLHKNNHIINALLHSQRIRDVVLARLARLPQQAEELLECAAVIGRPFPPTLLCSCLSTEEYKALDILLARHFLLETDGDDHDVYLTFAHEVVAQTVYAHYSAIKRAHLHRYIAEQLAHYYPNPTYAHAIEIASHYRRAGPQYQTQALHYEVQVENHLIHVDKRISL